MLLQPHQVYVDQLDQRVLTLEMDGIVNAAPTVDGFAEAQEVCMEFRITPLDMAILI
jgi:hypothetical protein